MQFFWIIGKTGILSKAFQRIFDQKEILYEVTSSQECDIASLQQLKKKSTGKNFTHILNCSAYTAVDLAEKEEERAFAVNARGPQNLTSLAKDMKAKVIHFSTDYVFDGKQRSPYKETDVVNPINVYGKTKESGERLLLELLPSSLIVRTSWIFSKDGHNFIKAMLKVMQERQEIQVIEDQIGKPTYVEDLALATLEILEERGIYHFANEDSLSRYDYAVEIFEELKNCGVNVKCKNILPVLAESLKGYAPRPAYSVLDTTKIQKLLRHPIRSHKVALKECLPCILKSEGSYVS